MLLPTLSKSLRSGILRIFGPSRPPKPRISLDRVDVFEVFALFSSHRLFDVSSGLFQSIFGSSGRVSGSSWDHFSWPKGSRDIEDPLLFDVYVPKFASHLANGAPGGSGAPKTSPNRPQNVPKFPPKCGPKARNSVSPELLHNLYSFLLLHYSVLLTKYYLLSTKYQFPSSFLLLNYSVLLSKYNLLKY